MVAAFAATLMVLGCASAPKEKERPDETQKSTEKSVSANNVDISARKATIIDWRNRTMGEEATPPWLKSLVKGNSGQIKREFDSLSPTDKVSYVAIINKNRNVGEVVAMTQAAAKVAYELRSTVLARAASTLDPESAEYDAVNDVAMEAKVTLSGQHNVTDFWQQVESENAETGEKEQYFNYYYVFSFTQANWDAIVRKYMNDIIGKLPDRSTQVKMANMFGEIAADTKREQDLSDEQFRAQLAAQQQAAQYAHQEELARTGGQTAVGVAEARASAPPAAPAGSPVAAVGSGDIDWISALSTVAVAVF
jgi:hypothetical protein